MNAWFRNIQHRIIAPDASISVQNAPKLLAAGAPPQTSTRPDQTPLATDLRSLQRSPRPPSCYGLGWRFGNNSSRCQFCAPLLVTGAPLFWGWLQAWPSHVWLFWNAHICMKHVIYYRLVITLNVAPLKVTNWLHWIALFQVWIFNISQGRGLHRPLPSSSNFVLHTDACRPPLKSHHWVLATRSKHYFRSHRMFDCLS